MMIIVQEANVYLELNVLCFKKEIVSVMKNNKFVGIEKKRKLMVIFFILTAKSCQFESN